MTDQEILEKVADRYRREGYAVTVRPGKGDLPAFLSDSSHRVDLLAFKGEESVVVQVRRRDELYDLGQNPEAEWLDSFPNWGFHVVVAPTGGDEEVPSDGSVPTTGQTESLLTEAEQLLGYHTPRAALLIAWSAAEAAMREVAHREGLGIEGDSPRFILKTLYSNGMISRDDWERLQAGLDLRNRLAHGLPPEMIEPREARFLVDFARRLLDKEPVRVDP